MIATFWPLFSWLFWFIWMGFGLAYELFAVRDEKRRGTLPLTRVIRDRLMRKHAVAKIGVMAFLCWLCLHFFTPLSW